MHLPRHSTREPLSREKERERKGERKKERERERERDREAEREKERERERGREREGATRESARTWRRRHNAPPLPQHPRSPCGARILPLRSRSERLATCGSDFRI